MLFYYLCNVKEKLKIYKLVGVDMSNQERLVSIGKLKQKGLAHTAYWGVDKHYYWVKRGQKI